MAYVMTEQAEPAAHRMLSASIDRWTGRWIGRWIDRRLDGFADFRERFWLADYAVLALAVALFARLLLLPADVEASLPDLRGYEPDVRKEMFLDFLAPIAVSVNEELLRDRRVIEAMAMKLGAGDELSWLDRMRLDGLAERYDVDVDIDGAGSDREVIDTLLRRADVIPVGLTLAQAAIESGWGTSRFAIDGNNLFGQRCYRAGCGLEPQDAGDDPGFYVAEFSSVRASVESYALNLNSHPRYRSLRRIRESLRADGEEPTTAALTKGLAAYSERRGDYMEDVRTVIDQNDLDELEARL